MKEEQTEATAQLALVPQDTAATEPPPLAKLAPEFASDKRVCELDAGRLELRASYEIWDGHFLNEIRKELTSGDNLGSGKWTRYLNVRGISQWVAERRIAEADGHPWSERTVLLSKSSRLLLGSEPQFKTPEAQRSYDYDQENERKAQEHAQQQRQRNADRIDAIDDPDVRWFEEERAKRHSDEQHGIVDSDDDQDEDNLDDLDDDDSDNEHEAVAAPARLFSDNEMIATAFRELRVRGFPFPSLSESGRQREIRRLELTPDKKLRTVRYGYALADMYHPERYEVKVLRKTTPIEAFDDDALLWETLQQYADEKGYIPENIMSYLSCVHGTQTAANFRPGYALSYYRDRRYCPPDAVILDTSAGFGGRLVGFIASGAARYIGIDPNKVTQKNNRRMAIRLGVRHKVKLITLPAEDVPHKLLRGTCDFALTSPPYGSKEHYGNEPTQSYKCYPDGEPWCKGFLRPMFDLQYAALKPGCYSVVNIASVTIEGVLYRYDHLAIREGKAAGFIYVGSDIYRLPKPRGKNLEHKDRDEPVLIFKKPD